MKSLTEISVFLITVGFVLSAPTDSVVNSNTNTQTTVNQTATSSSISTKPTTVASTTTSIPTTKPTTTTSTSTTTTTTTTPSLMSKKELCEAYCKATGGQLPGCEKYSTPCTGINPW